MKAYRFIFIFCLVFLLVASMVLAIKPREGEILNYFPHMHIKEDFCGIEMDYRFCKCAFHKQFCESVDMDRDAAHNYIYGEYVPWKRQKIKEFAQGCMDYGGVWNRPAKVCIQCKDGYLREQTRCVAAGSKQDVAGIYGLSPDPGVPKPKPGEYSYRSRAKVSAADGEVFVYSAAFQKWIGPVRGGQPIYAGDILRTTDRGTAKVTLYSRSGEDTIDISTETLLELPNTSPKPEESLPVALYNGAIRIYEALTEDGPRQPSGFNVRTPTIVTGRRGTDYIVTYDEDTEISEVYVLDGSVEVFVEGSSRPVFVEAGESATHTDNIVTATLSEDDFDEALAELGLDGDQYISSDDDLIWPTHEPIDPESIIPFDAVVSGDLVGEVIIEEDKNGFRWGWFIFLFIVAALYFSYLMGYFGKHTQTIDKHAKQLGEQAKKHSKTVVKHAKKVHSDVKTKLKKKK